MSATAIISSEANAPTPSAGEVTLFINTDKNNILYAKYPDGSIEPYGGDAIISDIAKTWADRVTCSLSTGMITAGDFGTIMNAGVEVQSNTTTDADGNITTTVTVGSRTIALTAFAINASTATVSTGSPHQITTTFTPSNATNQGVTYVSSDVTKATVSSTGVVTKVANGNCIISVIPNGNPALALTVTVTVS